jgi:hypothetical protein
MFRRSHFSSIVMMMVGGLLGSAGASGRLNPVPESSANAASGGVSALRPSEIGALGAPKVGSCEEAKREELLALATHNESVQGNASQAGKKPNILVIWGDDIGISNISAYSDGLMGYTTPNIDRVAKEGIRFLHYYGEQSCTAGRAAFLTGQHGIRTGLTKVGFPSAPMGMSQLDPSIGGLL